MASIISDPSLDPAIKQVIQDLITYGDDKTKEAEWQNLFAENSCFRIGKIEFKGADERHNAFLGSWAAMTWRKHTIHKIYNLGKEDEVMCYGSIEFTGLDGSKGTGEYAMRFVFERVEGGGVKIALEDVFGTPPEPPK